MVSDLHKNISWLHLSDIHFGHPDRRNDSFPVLESLLVDIKQVAEHANVRPDFVFFTGDLAFGQLHENPSQNSLSAQLSQGAEYLKKICDLFSPPIPWRRVFVVPGNHDLNRDNVIKDDTEFLRSPDRRLSDIEGLLTHTHLDRWKSIVSRQEEFKNLLASHFGHIPADENRLIYSTIEEVQGLKIGIAGLNSSWSCCQDGEQGQLWMGGCWQVNHLLRKLQDATFRIALLHHPACWFTMEERSAFWRPTLQSEFDLVLHGHEHETWVDAKQNGHVTIAAGATYEKSTMPTGFNLMVFRPKARSADIWLRRYNSRGRGWVADPDRRHTNTDGVWNVRRLGRNYPNTTEVAILDEVKEMLGSESLGSESLGSESDEVAEENIEHTTVLDLKRLHITDLAPLRRMHDIEVLTLRNTEVTKLDDIKHLKHLERLGLGSTPVRDIEAIGQLKKLVQLGLSRTHVSDLTPLKKLTRLRELDIRFTEVHNLEPLANLRKLERLYLGGTKVIDLSPLSAMARLCKLGLAGTPIVDLSPLSKLSKLKFLSLRGCSEISSFAPLNGLSNLLELRLSGTRVRDCDLEVLGSLAYLKILDIRNTQIQSLCPLHELKALRELNIRGTTVAEPEVSSLQKSLPELVVKR